MTKYLVPVPSTQLVEARTMPPVDTSIHFPRDEAREIRESIIRTEGMVKAVTDQFGEFKFRMDSHDKRLTSIETKMIHNEGYAEGRQAVTKKVDKMAIAIIGAIGTLAGAAFVAIAHKFGLA
jgi:hypothetical protein